MGKLTYNTRLVFKNDADRNKMLRTLEAERFCWNECSKIKFSVSSNSIRDLHNSFYKKFRESQPQIPAGFVIRSENSVLSAYRSIKSNKHKINQPPVKKRLSMRLDHNIFNYKKGVVNLASVDKRVKCQLYLYPKLEEFLSKYKFCDPLIFEREGEIWIALTFNIPETIVVENLAVGVDLGCRVAVATSEGKIYIDKKFNNRKRKIRYLKRSLQSKGTKSAKRHLRRVRHKERNISKDFCHKLTTKIINGTNADVIAVENLKSIKVKKNKYKNQNRLSQIALLEIRQMLTYKAPLAGKTVIEVCPSYTSQIDHVTGKKDGERKGRRYYSTTGTIYDADINAAINIGLRSKLPVSQAYGLTYGQALVVVPTVDSTESANFKK